MDANEIKKLQVDRLRYLESAYHQSKGAPNSYIPWEETGQNLGFDRDRTIAVMYWLKNEGLIKLETFNSFQITNYGIKIIEDAITNPEEPVGPLIAYNSIQIDQMINSTIQQGSVNSTQEVTIQQNDVEKIITLIDKLEASLEKINLAAAQRQDITADLETIKAQTKSSKPKNQIIVDALNSISAILQALPATQVIVSELIPHISQVVNALGSH